MTNVPGLKCANPELDAKEVEDVQQRIAARELSERDSETSVVKCSPPPFPRAWARPCTGLDEWRSSAAAADY